MGKKEEKISVEEARKLVSELIFKVLTDRICVREAIKLFPPDITDPSIVGSWHALVHYEADEDFRRRDLEYAKEQNDYLEMIAFMLKDGNALPTNILSSYDKYYDMALIPNSKGFWGWLKSLMRFTI